MSSKKPKKPKKHRILRVQVSFEASRVSEECLADAYEQVVPLRSRATLADDQQPPKQGEQTLVFLEDASLFDSSDLDCYDYVTNS